MSYWQKIAPTLPIDYAGLQKGDVIEREDLEKATGAVYGTDDYSFAIMAIRAVIEREQEARGTPVTTCCHKGSIAVLEDQMATVTNEMRFRVKISGLFRDNHRMRGVDRTQLSDQQRERHDRNLTIQSTLLSSIVETGRRLVQLGYQRIVPGRISFRESEDHAGECDTPGAGGE